MTQTAKAKRRGSGFEQFLVEQAMLEEVDEAAVKRVLAWQLGQALSQQGLNKSQLARRMDTSLSQIDRLLDPDNTGVTLHTMHRAAAVLGKRLRISLDEAAE